MANNLFEAPFNPFDALGLDVGTYNKKEIRQAWKHVALKVHPDKRTIPASQFPSVDDITKAQEYLQSAISTSTIGAVAKQYELWPRSFFPDQSSISPQVLDLPQHMMQCLDCTMVLSRATYPDHVEQHDRTLCKFCQRAISNGVEGGLSQHIQTHGFKQCDMCTDLVQKDDELAHEVFHKCPHCDTRVPKEGLLEHFREEHDGQSCPKCHSGPDRAAHEKLAGHILNDHKVFNCVLCEFKTCQPWKEHLSASHLIQPCTACDPASEGFLRHLQLKETHDVTGCALCQHSVASDGMMFHLVEHHGFQRCNGCTKLDPVHIKKDHTWVSCAECETLYREDSLSIHLVIDHDWINCPWCDSVVQDKVELREHISQHVLRVCDECSQNVDEKAYSQHLRDKHGRQECPFCNVSEPLNLQKLRKHLLENHLSQNEDAGRSAERIDSHGGSQAPAGSSEEKKKKADEPAASRTGYNAPGTCPECGVHYAYLDEHRRKSHNVRKRQKVDK